MSNALYRATAEALRDAAADPGMAVVVLTGNGRAFCAGQDLGEMASAARALGERRRRRRPRFGTGSGFAAFTDGLIRFPKPVIAAVNGLAVGIGFTMLAHCDLVLIADTARLRAPFTTLGVCPEAASSATFPAIMGQQTAAYYLYTAEWMRRRTPRSPPASSGRSSRPPTCSPRRRAGGDDRRQADPVARGHQGAHGGQPPRRDRGGPGPGGPAASVA